VSAPDQSEFIPRGERLRVVGGAVLRTLLGLTFLVGMLFLIPAKLQLSLMYFVVVVVIVAAIYTLHFRSQFRRIRKAAYPGLQATEALILTGALFLTTFAAMYFVISGENQQAFNVALTHMSALYFTVTVFATVGFGDIVAVADLARALVTLQMVLGLGFLVLIAKVFFGYVQIIREQRKTNHFDS